MAVAYNPQGSTAALNAAGDLDTPEGRAAYPGTSYPTVGAAAPSGATPTQGSGALQQLGGQVNSLLGAIASGNAKAFDEAVRQFNLSFGLDKDKFAESIRQFNENFNIAESGVTGYYQAPGATLQQGQMSWDQASRQLQAMAGTTYNDAAAKAMWQQLSGQGGNNFAGNVAQTLSQAQANALATAGGVPAQMGMPTMQREQQTYAQQMGMIAQAASLQANPFRQQQAIGQMGRLLGGQAVSGFQAPQTVPGVGIAGGNTQGGMGYLSQLIDDIKDPNANTASMNQVLQGIPTPTKVDSVDFFKAAPSTQSMVLQGMQEKYGLDPQDALRQITNTLPQFQAPTTFGTVKR